MRSVLGQSFLCLLSSLVLASFNARAHGPAGASEPRLGDIVFATGAAKQFCSIEGATTGVCYMTAQKAAEYCETVGGRLPSALQFKQLGGVDPNSPIDELYWTSSRTATSDGQPMMVNGTTGFSGAFDANEPLAVRCVEDK